MPELILKDINDLKKLDGWMIKKARKIQNSVPEATIGLVLSHQAAEKDILLKIYPTVRFGRSGNVVICNENLSIEVFDYEEVEKKEGE